MASDLRMDVQPYGDGRVLLTLGDLSLTLDAEGRDKLRELLLDRAAMPGQPLTVAAVSEDAMTALGELADAAQGTVTQAEVNRCGWSEDPYHRCRVCHDYATGRDRDHPLKAGAQEAAGDG